MLPYGIAHIYLKHGLIYLAWGFIYTHNKKRERERRVMFVRELRPSNDDILLPCDRIQQRPS